MNPKPFSSQASSQSDDRDPMAPAAQPGIGRETHGLASDLEDVVTTTTSISGAELARAKARLGQELEDARDALTQRARRTATATDAFVRANPWRAAGYAAAAGTLVGLLAGLLIARR